MESASSQVRSSKLSLRRKRGPQQATCSTQPAQLQTSSSLSSESEALPPPSLQPPSCSIHNLSLVLSRCTQVQTSVSSKSVPSPPRQPPIHSLSPVVSWCTQTRSPGTLASNGDRRCEDATDVRQSEVVSCTGAAESTTYCEGGGTKKDKTKDIVGDNTCTSPIHTSKALPESSYDCTGRTGDGFGELFFCQMCQKDLTHLNATRRTQHVNRCCDSVAQVVESAELASHTCFLCKREFKAEQTLLSHMKGCARKKDVSTAQLLSMRRKEMEAAGGEGGDKSSSRTTEAGMSSGSMEAGVTRVISGEEDFRQLPPPKRARPKQGRKRRRAGGQVGYVETLDDELQLALALSASMNPQAMQGSGKEEGQRTGLRGKGKKRSKKGECSEAPPPLLLTSSSQAENMAAEKAAQILEATEGGGPSAHDDDIPCTPAFGASELGGAGPASLQHSVRSPPHTLDAVDELLLMAGDEPEHVTVDPNETTITAPTEESPGEDQHVEEAEMELGASGAGGTAPQTRERGDEVTTVLQAGVTPPTSSGMPSSTMANTAGCWSPLDLTGGEDLGYPTLWQMSSLREEVKETANFYVPALAPVISPVKRDTCLCRICGCEPCLAVATSGPEGDIDCSATARTSAVCGSPATPTTTAGFVITEDEPHTSGVGRLVADLRSLVGSRLLSDVLITTRDGQEVPAHGVILAARCPALRKVLEECTCRPVQLDFSDSSDDTVLAFLEHVYCAQGPPLHLKEAVESLLSRRWSLEGEWLRPLQETVGNSDGADEQRNLESGREGAENCDETVCELKQDSSRMEWEIVETRPGVEGDGCALGTCMTDGGAVATVQSNSASPNRAGVVKRTSPHEDSGVLQSPSDSGPMSRTIQDNGSRSVAVELQGETVPTSDVSCPVEIINDPSDSSMEGDATTTVLAGSVYVSECLAHGDDNPGYVEVADTLVPSPGTLSPSLVVTSQPLGEAKDVTELDTSPTFGDNRECGSNEVFTIESRSPSVQAFSSPDEPRQEPVGPQGLLPPCPRDGYHCETDTGITVDTSYGVFNSWDEEHRTEMLEASGTGPTAEETLPTGQCHPLVWSGAHTPTPLSVSSSSTCVQPGSLPCFVSPGASLAVSGCSGVGTAISTRPCAATPACCRTELESDDNITPMPDYRGMRTPQLKDQCSRFGVRVLPKKKMINKLEEIYNYTHPLVDEDGNIVLPPLPPPLVLPNRKPKAADAAHSQACSTTNSHGSVAASSSEGPDRPRHKSKQKPKQQNKEGENSEQAASGGVDTMETVRDAVAADTQLYQDVLLYKPLELSFIQERLKLAGVSVGKDKLADILDRLCVTFTQPRNLANTQRPRKKTRLQ